MTAIPLESPNAHEVAVKAYIEQLRAMQESIAGYGFVSSKHRRSINAAATVPDRFLEAVAVACDAVAHLASGSLVTGAELRDTVAFARAYTSLADELERLARGMRDTVAVRRSDAGSRALRAYSVAKSYNRPSDLEPLIPHLREMQRALGRGRPSSRTASPVPPVPTPVPTTPDPPVNR